VWHTVGYPLDQATYGGSFLYHMSDSRVALGCAAGKHRRLLLTPLPPIYLHTSTASLATQKPQLTIRAGCPCLCGCRLYMLCGIG
jgi:flavin-dependent dehydrogenase